VRLWSLHPKYLDAKGLSGGWREALLARKVLMGDTSGYKHHPQLERFYKHPDPVGIMNVYLYFLYLESVKRNYNFDRSKINTRNVAFESIPVTIGQLVYEAKHLKEKVSLREPRFFREVLVNIIEPEPHPIFYRIEGNIESWEKVKS
jgi:hypothetical protein